MQAGSSLSLECVVRHTHSAPAAVIWYHGTQVLDYDSPRGGIALQVFFLFHILLFKINNADKFTEMLLTQLISYVKYIIFESLI